MRKYQPDKMKEIMDSLESYGPIVQVLGLMNEGWEPDQLFRFYLEYCPPENIVEDKSDNVKIKLAKPKPVVKRVTRRKYQSVRCPYCSFVSKPGPVASHITYRHQDKKLTGELLKPIPFISNLPRRKSLTEEHKAKMAAAAKVYYQRKREEKEDLKKQLDSLVQSNTWIGVSS